MDIPKIIQNSNIQSSDINKVIHFESIVDDKFKGFILEELIYYSEPDFNSPWVDIALSYDGVDERREDGQKLIKEFHKSCGNDFDYTVPWCASFVSHCLKLGGVKGDKPFGSLSSHFANSNDYIKLDKPKKGCIIYWKNINNSGGHVALVIDDEFDGTSVNTVGGNQSAYDKSGDLAQVTIGPRKLNSSTRNFIGFYYPKQFDVIKSSHNKIDKEKTKNFFITIQKVLNKSLYKREQELIIENGILTDETYVAMNEIDYDEFCYYYYNTDKLERMNLFTKGEK